MSSVPANTYLHGHHASVLRSHQWRTAQNSAAHLLPFIKPSSHILDVGCGPGTITADFVKMTPHGRVVAIDSAADIVKTAKEAIDKIAFGDGSQDPAVDAAGGEAALAGDPASGIAGKPSRVHCMVADIHGLDPAVFPDDSFDIVHAHQVLQHVSDPVRALQEMRRVARPKTGIVACRDSDYTAFTWYPPVSGLDRWKQVYIQSARSTGGEPDAGRRLKSWAMAAGFAPEHIISSASAWCFSTREDRTWWSELWAERVVKSRFAETAVQGGFVAGASELEELAQAWREWGQADDGWFAVLHGEIICQKIE